MGKAVLKAASYILVNGPDMVMEKGATQTTEKIVNPDSEYLKVVTNHLRSFEDFVSYPPNQCYIGNITPDELKEKYEFPWYDKKIQNASKKGKYGEILEQDEFIGLMQICDVFDLVVLESQFVENVRAKLENNTLITESLKARLKAGVNIEEIQKYINEDHAETLVHNGELVGCIKRAHEVDVNLSAHVICENLVVKASGVLSLLKLIEQTKIDPAEIEYVVECSEEACGDVLQRGGGNFAKAIAEIAGCTNATGSDTRAFCAAPTHSLIEASALVSAGIYKNVVVVAGGCTSKLGMNGKDHVKKGLPILEDAIGGFAVLISENDGVHPIMRTDLVGRHTVGTGSSPQAVIQALILNPLLKDNLKITDIDKYSVEMQNPDITKPAGAGDVPYSNYKMIGALAVKNGEIEKSALEAFIETHGMPGWAPTQGHIPSGIPYAGFAIDQLTNGNLNKVMIVGKGSLFLGRMTNLFDGVSIVVERNDGQGESKAGMDKETIRKMIAESMRAFATQLSE